MRATLDVVALVVVGLVAAAYVYKTRNDSGEYHPPGKLERKISARIDSCQSSQPCTIRLADVTDFDWDDVYVFQAGASRQTIESTIRAPFQRDLDMAPWLVFVKDGRVVYAEEDAWHVEKAAVSSVIFDPEKNIDVRNYKRDVKFDGSRSRFEKGYLYSLKTAH